MKLTYDEELSLLASNPSLAIDFLLFEATKNMEKETGIKHEFLYSIFKWALLSTKKVRGE